MHNISRHLLFCAAALSEASAQGPPPQATLVSSAEHRIRSRIVGAEFVIRVALPVGYDTAATRFPVIFGLDGSTDFWGLQEVAYDFATSQDMPPTVVVGIGWPADTRVDTYGLRHRDLTPTSDTAADRTWPSTFERMGLRPRVWQPSGGGERFLDFIAQELVPFIERTYRVDSTQRVIVGHSLGGLLVVHAFATRPTLFARGVATSPWLQWDRRVIIRTWNPAAQENGTAQRRLFIAVESEDAGATVRGVRALDSLLVRTPLPGTTTTVQYFDDETHGSMEAIGMSRGLRAIFGTWPKKR